MTETYRFTTRWIDGKQKKVIVDICGDIIDKNPIKEDLKGLGRYLSTREICKLPKEEKRKHLLEFLKYFSEKEERSPEIRDFINNSKFPSFVTYQREFGTWNNALIEAGLETNDKKYSRKQLIEKMQQFSNENNRPPKMDDFVNNPKYPGYDTYLREFGGWNNAKIMAGFETNDNTARSRQAEIQTIQEFKTEGAIDLSGQNRNSTCQKEICLTQRAHL